MVEGGALLALSLLFDRIDRAPARVRAARGKLGSLTGPVWAVLVAAICISLNQAQLEIWRSAQSVWRPVIFVLACGLPPVLYTVARGYRAQLDEPDGGLSIHAPWLILGALMVVGIYAVGGALNWAAPWLNPVALVLSSGIILLTAFMLTGPFLMRKWFAIEHPMDWSSAKGRVAAELVEGHGFPRSRVHLLELKGHSRLVNAMATGIVPAGARIFVTVDLMKELSANEVAAVLAHEIGHVRGRHLAGAFVLQIGLLTLLNGALFLTQSLVRLIEPIALGGVVFAILGTTFGLVLVPVSIAAAFRAAEKQADRYAADAGYGHALASALERLPGPDPDADDTPFILRAFSLHPSRSSRIEALRTAAA